MASTNRWLKPELYSFSSYTSPLFSHSYHIIEYSVHLMTLVYPLFAAVGVAVGIFAMQLVRNISTNPEVRVTKENRAAGILDNFEEGERYAEHGLRKFVSKRPPQIMPSINNFFSDPN